MGHEYTHDLLLRPRHGRTLKCLCVCVRTSHMFWYPFDASVSVYFMEIYGRFSHIAISDGVMMQQQQFTRKREHILLIFISAMNVLCNDK